MILAIKKLQLNFDQAMLGEIFQIKGKGILRENLDFPLE